MFSSKTFGSCIRFKYIDQKIKKCNNMIELIRRLSVNLPRNALLTVYKSFIRSHLDHGEILYDKTSNDRAKWKKYKKELV